MSAFVKTRVPSCCGNFTTVYRLNFPLRKESVSQFEAAGFTIDQAFFRAGMLYADSSNFFISGRFGSTNLDVRCKIPKCEDLTTAFDVVLTQLYDAIPK